MWRTDPARSGAGGSVGDIGTHVYHLMSFVTGLEANAICADLATFVGQRKVDDNAHLLLRFKGGANGMIWASQVAVGCENGLQLRVFGDKGGIVWRQENPNELMFSPLGAAQRRITRGGHGSGDAAARVTRIPAGHPEGFIEGFANIYTEIAAAIRAVRDGSSQMQTSVIQPQPTVKEAWHLSTPRYGRVRTARGGSRSNRYQQPGPFPS